MGNKFLSPNNFLSIFDEVEDLIFNRPFKDMRPIVWEESEDGYTGYCITTGIRPEDVEVTAADGYIRVKGATKHEDIGQEFSQSFAVRVNPNIFKNIEEINYTSKDGVTKIKLKVKKVESKIKINRI